MDKVLQEKLDLFQYHENIVVSNVLSGQPQLFELLISKNNLKLSRLVRRYIKNKEEINDILQETYLKAFKNLHQFRFQASFFTWISRIAINETLQFLKRKDQFVSYYTLNGGDFAWINFYNNGQGENPYDLLIQEEDKILLGNAIAALDLKYRTPFQLKQAGWSVIEIGRFMGISSTNVKVRLYRARKKIRTRMLNMA